MLLTERLQSIRNDARRIQESLELSRDPGANVLSVEAGDRLVRQRGQRWEQRVAECAEMFADVFAGRRPSWHLKEAMTTSDFPNLFGDLLYRQLLGAYVPYQVSYPSWAKKVTVNDFRALHLYGIEGLTSALTDIIKEQAPYPEGKFAETPYSLQVAKYGRKYYISFEMVVNDDLNAFSAATAHDGAGGTTW
jgi:hypothetical protein